jgi:hypothetical protein
MNLPVKQQEDKLQRKFGRPNQRPNFPSPVCSICGSRNLRPFSAIYGRGTTVYKRIKGLFLKHGYSVTTRQSVLAKKCRPPLKMPWSPSIFGAALYFLLGFVSVRMRAISYDLDVTAYYVAWVSFLLALITALNNWAILPGRMSVWSRSMFCERCGTVNIVQR